MIYPRVLSATNCPLPGMQNKLYQQEEGRCCTGSKVKMEMGDSDTRASGTQT